MVGHQSLVVLFLLITLSTGVEVVKQGTLYEWNPGDSDKANALGSEMIVGYYHDFVYLERRALFQFSTNHTDLKITFTITPAETDFNLTVCNMLQAWGQGNSSATNPVVGTTPSLNDATWRYPFYGQDTSWEDRILGGYFDALSGIDVTVIKNDTQFEVEVPPSKYGYVILLREKVRGMLHIYGQRSDHPPTAEAINMPATPNLDFLFYVIPVAGGLLLFMGSLIVYLVLKRRRDDYMPLLDLEEGDVHLSQLQGIEKVLIEAKVRRVAEHNIEYGKRIGSGTTGEVYSAKLGNVYVAVKKIKLQNLTQGLSRERIISSISSEITILSKLDHKNILSMIGLVIGEGYEDFGIVTRLMRKGNLTYTLYNNDEDLSLKIKLKIIQGIAAGMLYLHKQKPTIIHRDLKPENILIDDDYVPKITDFGISRFIEGTLQNMTLSGTPSYMAPESFTGARGGFSKKSDVFSFGVIVTEIITQKRPNAGEQLKEIMMNRAQGVYSFTLPNEAPLVLQEIVAESTTSSPGDRPSFSDIVLRLKQV